MSLALWEFFWDWDGSPPAPSPSPTPAPGPTQPPAPLPDPPTDSGGGGGKGWGKGGKQREYVPNPVDLWEARETYLRSIQPPPPPAPRPEEYEAEANAKYLARQQELEQANADRSAALIAMQAAADLKTMKSHGAKVKELNAKIATLTAKQSFARFMK
jgi:hypothetical protein